MLADKNREADGAPSDHVSDRFERRAHEALGGPRNTRYSIYSLRLGCRGRAACPFVAAPARGPPAPRRRPAPQGGRSRRGSTGGSPRHCQVRTRSSGPRCSGRGPPLEIPASPSTQSRPASTRRRRHYRIPHNHHHRRRHHHYHHHHRQHLRILLMSRSFKRLQRMSHCCS